MKTIDIICPVFREQEIIGKFHDRLVSVVEKLKSEYRIGIIYVLDPAPDHTEEILKKISADDERVKVLVMSRRFGHQAALIAGIDRARGDAVIMLDSDLQHPPEVILELVDRWRDGADIVQTIRDDGDSVGYFKHATSQLFYNILFRIASIDLRPGAADYRLLSRRVADVFQNEMRERNPFLRGLISWVGFNICYVPFEAARREGGKSKYKLSTLFNFALNGTCSFSKFPLRFCIGVGISLSLISIVFATAQIISYFSGAITVPGWSSLFTAISFIGGVQLFFFGVLGEYVSLIFDEVKARPRYIIAREHEAGGAEESKIDAPGTRDS